TTNNPASISFTDTANSANVVINSGGLTTSSNGAISIINTGTNSYISLNNAINAGSGTITLTATGSANISAGGVLTTSGTLNLTSGSGLIGNLTTSAGTVSFGTTGTVNITDTNTAVVVSNTGGNPNSITFADSANSATITVGSGGLTTSSNG